MLEQNIGNPTVEVMWARARIAARRAGDARPHRRPALGGSLEPAGRRRLERLVRTSVGYRIWTQLLYGTVAQYISPAHGFAGNVAALAGRPRLLGPERTAELEREAVRTSTVDPR